MSPARFDILGIGNAIVDVVASADDGFISKHDMTKGGMQLISAEQAEALYAAMPPGQETSGGSAANTVAVAAGWGARTAFLGKVADDDLGRAFRHDITETGVHYPTEPLFGAAPTARCLILVTPDAQRTMNTYLGACVGFARNSNSRVKRRQTKASKKNQVFVRRTPRRSQFGVAILPREERKSRR